MKKVTGICTCRGTAIYSFSAITAQGELFNLFYHNPLAHTPPKRLYDSRAMAIALSRILRKHGMTVNRTLRGNTYWYNIILIDLDRPWAHAQLSAEIILPPTVTFD